MAEQEGVPVLNIFAALLLLSGNGRVVAMTFNRETGMYTMNVTSPFFVWHEPATAAANRADCNPLGGTADCPDISELF